MSIHFGALSQVDVALHTVTNYPWTLASPELKQDSRELRLEACAFLYDVTVHPWSVTLCNATFFSHLSTL